MPERLKRPGFKPKLYVRRMMAALVKYRAYVGGRKPPELVRDERMRENFAQASSRHNVQALVKAPLDPSKLGATFASALGRQEDEES